MANKFRPKGSYKDYLDLNAQEISALSEDQLRGIVNKLNDAANKRMKRLEQSGYAELSPAYRGRMQSKKGYFRISGNETPSQLKAEYLSARSFLRPESTSSRKGIETYNKRFESTYEKILGKPFNDASNFDKRYKTKKVLRKPIRKKIRDFWANYEKWKEIQGNKFPDSARGDTNLNDVEYFEEEIYNQGKANVSDMEQKAREQYEEAQRKALKEEPDNENANISTNPAKRRGTKKIKQNKYKGKGSTIKTKFEKIKIFD